MSSIRDTSSVRHSAVISFSNSYMLTSKEFLKYQFHSELAELCHNRSPVRVSGGSQTILCKYILDRKCFMVSVFVHCFQVFGKHNQQIY